MSLLREVETLGYHAFLEGDDGPFAAHLVAGHIPATVRIEVYQNNVRETFRKCLARAYPVVERLVGEPCFRGLAHAYALVHPSTSGDLQSFGARFPKFLAAQYAASEFDYLAPVAELEWAIEQVLLEAESTPAELGPLRDLDPGCYGELRFAPAPGVRFVGSRYPVLAIWSANQPGQSRGVDLDAGPEHVALKRRGGEATLRRLDPATFELGRRLASREPLATAAAGLEADLATALGVLVAGGYLGPLTLPPAAADRRQP